MKVLFIVPYPTEGPSNRFRIEQYLPSLEEKRIIYLVRPFYNSYIYRVLYKKGYYLRKSLFFLLSLLRRIFDIFSARTYDLVFIHREAYPFAGYFFELFFRLSSRRIIYDFDDSLFIKKPLKVKKIISISDHITVGNSFLKDYASKYNKNISVLPTCIDTRLYQPKIKSPNDGKVIVGWIGTSFTAIYLELLRGVYSTLSNRYKHIEFRVVGGYIQDANLAVKFKEWSLDSEVSDLHGFDIGVMPLFDDDWARGKCAFKIIQYMAVGIPPVASRVGMNVEVIDDGKDGFLVGSSEEWIDRLSLLIEDKELRKRMGMQGRRKVESLYSVEASKEKYIAILEKVWA